MSHATVFRQVSRVRRSPVPRPSSGAGLSSFGKMLARLGVADKALKSARPRRRA